MNRISIFIEIIFEPWKSGTKTCGQNVLSKLWSIPSRGHATIQDRWDDIIHTRSLEQRGQRCVIIHCMMVWLLDGMPAWYTLLGHRLHSFDQTFTEVWLKIRYSKLQLEKHSIAADWAPFMNTSRNTMVTLTRTEERAGAETRNVPELRRAACKIPSLIINAD